MKKALLIVSLISFLILLPLVLAIDLKIEKEVSEFVIIDGLHAPIEFNLSVTNEGEPTRLQFYNLLGFVMNPIEKIEFEQNETKNIAITIFPRDDLNIRGNYNFKYFIQNDEKEQIEQNLLFKIIGLDDVFSISVEEITLNSDYANITITNKVDFRFEEINLTFISPFFSDKKQISLDPYEKTSLRINLERENLEGIHAGFYTLKTEIDIEKQNTEISRSFKFSEESSLERSCRDSGFIIKTTVIEEENKGNVVAISSIKVEKNIISRLFTSFSVSPDFVERDGTSVFYTWENRISPGEKFSVSVKTNWLFPILIVLFLAFVSFIIKKYSVKELSIRKRVSFVKVKGGEFALKVSIVVSARDDLEKVNIVDRYPPLVRLFERFGHEKPIRVDEEKRKLEWSFDKLDKGEKKILSYLIYSKLGVLGKFELPPSKAFYEKNGEIKETESNKAFFISEQKAEKKSKEQNNIEIGI